MQKIKTFYTAKSDVLFILKNGYVFLIFLFLFVLGIFIGSATSTKYEFVKDLSERLVNDFSLSHSAGKFAAAFLFSIKFWAPFYLLAYIMGTTFTGAVILPLIVLYKGFCYGAMTGSIYGIHALNGLIYTLLLIIPSMLPASFGLIFIAGRGFKFSTLIFKGMMPNSRIGAVYPQMIYFSKSMVLFLFLLCLGAVTDGITCSVFSKIITL